jgi:hypothetical protein
MHDGHKGMSKDHPRTSIAHDGLDTLSQFWSVAVDRALGAGRLVLLKGASVQALEGVLQQVLALWAERPCRPCPVSWRVMGFAVEADHDLYCLSFADHAGVPAG